MNFENKGQTVITTSTRAVACLQYTACYEMFAGGDTSAAAFDVLLPSRFIQHTLKGLVLFSH